MAEEVFEALTELTAWDPYARAGPSPHGYVHPVDAAWEVVDGLFEPFREQVARLAGLGFEDAAPTVCEGVLLGLYRAERETGCDAFEHVPDLAAEVASFTLSCWLEAPGSGRGRRRLDDAFVAEAIPEWTGLVEHVVAAAGRRR